MTDSPNLFFQVAHKPIHKIKLNIRISYKNHEYFDNDISKLNQNDY